MKLPELALLLLIISSAYLNAQFLSGFRRIWRRARWRGGVLLLGVILANGWLYFLTGSFWMLLLVWLPAIAGVAVVAFYRR